MTEPSENSEKYNYPRKFSLSTPTSETFFETPRANQTLIVSPSHYDFSANSLLLQNNKLPSKAILKKCKSQNVLIGEGREKRKGEEKYKKKIGFKSPLKEIHEVESYKDHNVDVSEMYFFCGLMMTCKDSVKISKY